MRLLREREGPGILAVCCWLGLGLLVGRAAEDPASGGAQPGTIELTREELLDHIRGGWTGMLIGGIEGLAHEFKYIQEPRASLPEYRFLPDGARSDDDNDFEWTHLWFMDRLHDASRANWDPEPQREKGPLTPAFSPSEGERENRRERSRKGRLIDQQEALKIGYPRIVEIWKANMNRGLWAANRQARKLMDEGLVPPETANPARNSFAPYNLSGQFCVEAYGMIAPGMPQTAVDLGVHYAGVAVSGEPLQATRYWTTLISLAAVRDEPLEELLREAARAVDPGSAQAEAVQAAVKAFYDHPGDWKAARRVFHEKWYVPKEQPWNPDARPRKWNDNSTPLNGAMVLLALLYGEGDFYKTGQYAMALGYDADCNAATACAVVGTRIGFAAMQRLPGFDMPDRYVNHTRPQLPKESKVSEQAELMMRLCERVIMANGGERVSIGGKPGYRMRLQAAK